ncbi:hypothetical protein H0H92_004352 [Tricholoma furcatifolium]|nr:hypothetical protein H0H92_004352 [Tricholoma furcatifolium]
MLPPIVPQNAIQCAIKISDLLREQAENDVLDLYYDNSDSFTSSLEPLMKRSHSEIEIEQETQNWRHVKRRKHRAETIARDGHIPRERTVMEYVQLAEPVLAPMSLQNLELDRGAYTATKKTGYGMSNQGPIYTEEELLSLGFKHIDWNGIDPIPLVDQDNHVFAVLAERPRDPTYLRDAEEVYNMIIEGGKTAKFDSKFQFHKRGNFPAVNIGPICGAGSEHPTQ